MAGSLSHRVWLGWEDEASSPQAAAVIFPMTLLLSWNGFRCFPSICIPPFWSANIAPAHSSSLWKNWAQIVTLKVWQKTYRTAALVSLSVFTAKLQRPERLVQQIMFFAYLSAAVRPKTSKGLSLRICVWYETTMYVKSILWQSFLGILLGGKTKQDGVWIEPCVFGPFRGSHSWLETCTCCAQCCASAHVCVSWAPSLNPVHSSAHVSCASLGTQLTAVTS